MEPVTEQIGALFEDNPNLERYLHHKLEANGYKNSGNDASVRHAAASLIEDIYEVAEFLSRNDSLISFQAMDASTSEYLEAGVVSAEEDFDLSVDEAYLEALMFVRENVDYVDGRDSDRPERAAIDILKDLDAVDEEDLDREFSREERPEPLFQEGNEEVDLDEEDLEAGGGPEWF